MRLLRYLGWGHSDVRRHSDRVESRTACLLLMLFLISLPISAAIGYAVYQQGSTVARESHAAGHWTTAVLLEDAALPDAADRETSLISTPEAKARWRSADGGQRSGTVSAQSGDRAGDRIQVWLGSAGTPTDPPANENTIVANAVAAGVLAVMIAAAALESTRRLVRWRLDRTRMEAWDIDWARVEPQWTQHHR